LQGGCDLNTFQLPHALALLFLSALQMLFSAISLFLSSKLFPFALLHSRIIVTVVTHNDESPLVAGYGWLEMIDLATSNSDDKAVINHSLPGFYRLSALAGCSEERKKRNLVDRSSNQQDVDYPSCSSTGRSMHGITAGRRLAFSLLLAASSLLFGEVSSFQHHRAFPGRVAFPQRTSPTSLLATTKKWISLFLEEDGVPRVFGINLGDGTVVDVDDLKEAIKKKNPNDLRHVDAGRLVLEYPAGTVLAEDSPISEITGGEKKSEPILARLSTTHLKTTRQPRRAKSAKNEVVKSQLIKIRVTRTLCEAPSVGTTCEASDGVGTIIVDGIPDFIRERYGYLQKLPFLHRKCYDSLYSKTKEIALSSGNTKPPVLLITGVPGIGKSLFGLFLIIEAMLDAEFPFKEIYLEFEKGVYRKLSFIDKSVDTSTLNHIQSVELNLKVEEGVLKPGMNDLIISDIKDRVEPKQQAKLLIILSSPNPQRYKQTMNAQVKYRLTMPTWSESEFEWFAGGKPVTQWYDRFVRFGGVPRHVLYDGVGIDPDVELEDAFATKGSMVMNYFIGNGFGDVDPQKSYMLMHINPKKTSTGEFDYSSGVVHSFASDYIYKVLQQKSERSILNRAISLFNTGTAQQTLGGSTAGTLFEKIVSWSVPLGGKTLELRGLTDKAKTFQIKVPLKTEFLTKSWKRGSGSFTPLLPGVLYQPRISNLESGDSFCVVEDAPDLFLLLIFQMTVGEEHSVKANGLCAIIEAYPDYVKQRMNKKILAFVIPMFGPLRTVQKLHTSDDKVIQKIPSELKDLEQYICEYKIEM